MKAANDIAAHDDFGPESHPLGWNRRDWVTRELPAPRVEGADTAGAAEPLAAHREGAA